MSGGSHVDVVGFALSAVLLFVGSVGVMFCTVGGWLRHVFVLSGCLILFLQSNSTLYYYKIHNTNEKANWLPSVPSPGDAIKLVPVPKRGDPPPCRAY